MATANGNEPVEIDIDPAIFQDFADLEKEFAKEELDALRRKEFAMRPLYIKRNVLSGQIPNFWPSAIMNGPQEFQDVIGDEDAEPLAALKSLNVERYEITSDGEGEPRSLRFTFEWDENDWFEDKKTVKEFKFVQRGEDDSGSLVSVPCGFRWKKKGRKGNNGLLDLAVDLWKAEEALGLKNKETGDVIKVVSREDLWQYEKLNEALAKAEEDDDVQPSWLDWFGYRGPVREAANDRNENEEDEDDYGLLDVEICPNGEEIALSLAEDLWPNVMDYFMASQQELQDFDEVDSHADEDEDEEDEDVPELVEVEETRPAKRQRQA